MPKAALKPLSLSTELEEAKAAWSAADYQSVLKLLRDTNSPSARLLQAKTYIRLRNLSQVNKVLAGFSSSSKDEEIEAQILCAYVADRRDVGRSAFENSTLGKMRRPEKKSRALYDLHSFYRAMALYMRERIDEAVQEATELTQTPDPLFRAWASELLGWISVSQKQFAPAIDHFENSLRFFEKKSLDEHKRRNSLYGYGLYAVELLDSDAIDSFLDLTKHLVPIASLGRLDSMIFTYAALGFALRNDNVRVVEMLIRAVSCAPDGPFKALPHVEFASFHARRGSKDAAALHLELARSQLDATDWQNQDDAGRLILLDYASECSLTDAALASRYFAKALNLSGTKDPTLAFDRNGRGMALALFVRGRIAAAQSNSEAGIKDISDAQELWFEMGCRYRGLIAQMDLLRLGDSARPNIRYFKPFQDSWIAVGVRSTYEKAQSPLSLISMAERKVLEGICDGLTSKQIAARLGRSHHTVRNQTMALYRALGVKTRSALVAVVMSAENTSS